MPWVIVPFVMLSLVPCALAGLETLVESVQRLSGVKVHGILSAVCVVLVVCEMGCRGTLLLDASSARVSSIYRQLNGEGVIELPFRWNSSHTAYYQAWHGGKTLGTQAIYPPFYGDLPGSRLADPVRFHENTFLVWLERTRDHSPDPIRPSVADARELSSAGYHWIILHRSPEGAPMIGPMADVLGAPAFSDTDVIAWRI